MYSCAGSSLYFTMSDCDAREGTENAVFLPEDDCSQGGCIPYLMQRVSALEDILDGKTEIFISKTDANNNTTTITVLGNVSS